MKLTAGIYLVIAAFITSCSSTRRFGTTIERDENNPCQVNIIIQVAVQGTDEDVRTIRSALEACYSQGCFIPCPNDSTKGCMTQATIVVKAYGEIPSDETEHYHYVFMKADDGLPSNAYLGRPNSGASSGEWRRPISPSTVCHEVLHFCGLEDKYCARMYDPVLDSVKTERNCVPPPDPNGNCCSPAATTTRCTVPCHGHDDNIMGSSWAGQSCDNIMDVLKIAGYENCPDECCGSDKTFSRPIPEYYLIPGYMNFGEKINKIGTWGVSIGGTKYLGSSLGVTMEAGVHTTSEKNDEVKQSDNLYHLNGGVNYKLPIRSHLFSVQSHALVGAMNYRQKTTVGDQTSNNSEISPVLNLGIGVQISLGRHWSIRLLEINYMPTFFFKTTQHNLQVGTGIVYIPGTK